MSVIIVTYNNLRFTQQCVASVNAYTKQPYEIVVVDNCSTDGTRQWLEGAADRREIHQTVFNDQNLGFPAGVNQAINTARGEYVLLLNNDVRLRPDCILPLAEHFADPGVFAVTGKLLNQAEDVFCNGGKVARFRRGMWSTYQNYDLLPGADPAQPLLSFTAIGAFSAYDRARFLDLGGFDPLTAMVEDIELSYRAWKRGWMIKYEPRSIACHDASQTMDRRYKRCALNKISRRSRILMHWMLLHDPHMFRLHQLSIALRLLASWLVLDWRFYWAVGTGFAHLPTILRKRRATRRTMARTDRELLELLQRFYSTAPIALY